MTHVCEICAKSFSLPSNLKRHVKTVHSEETFTCAECDKKFARSDNLKIHVSAMHKISNKNNNATTFVSSSSSVSTSDTQTSTPIRARDDLHVAAVREKARTVLGQTSPVNDARIALTATATTSRKQKLCWDETDDEETRARKLDSAQRQSRLAQYGTETPTEADYRRYIAAEDERLKKNAPLSAEESLRLALIDEFGKEHVTASEWALWEAKERERETHEVRQPLCRTIEEQKDAVKSVLELAALFRTSVT